MKKICLLIVLVLVVSLITVFLYFKFTVVNNMTEDELLILYKENKQIINNIKDGLFSAGYDNINIYIEKNEIFYVVPTGSSNVSAKFINIPSVHNDVIEYFKTVSKKLHPQIKFSKIFDNPVVQFAFYSNKVEKGIIFISTPDKIGLTKNIENNWYLYLNGQ